MDFLNNPMIQNMVLGKLKTLCKEKNISLVAIFYDKEKDEFDFKLCTGVNHIIPDEEFKQLQETFLKNL